MNAPLSPSTLRQMGEANELRPVSLREDPAYFEPEDAALPFSNDWADAWIKGLANADDARAYLDTSAIDMGEHEADLAPLLQDMAVAYRDKPGALHDLIGSRYFQTMKALAAVAYANQ